MDMFSFMSLDQKYFVRATEILSFNFCQFFNVAQTKFLGSLFLFLRQRGVMRHNNSLSWFHGNIVELFYNSTVQFGTLLHKHFFHIRIFDIETNLN